MKLRFKSEPLRMFRFSQAMELSLTLLFVYRNRSITLMSQNKVCLRFTAKNLYANELLINVWTDSRKKSPRKKQAQKCLKQIFKVKEWKMVNFKLGEQMWRWNNQHVTSVGQRKNLIAQHLIRTYDLPNTGRALYHWVKENSRRARPYTRFIFDSRLACC